MDSIKGIKDRISSELEDHFVLRLPQTEADYIKNILHSKPKKIKKRLSIDLDPKSGKGRVYIKGKRVEGTLRKLPTISETYKTYNGNLFMKTADVCHIFDCSRNQNTNLETPHGLTPPLKNIKKKRFRKSLINKDQDNVNVHKELCYLLQADYEAVSSSFEVIEIVQENSDPNNNKGSQRSEIALFGNVLTDSEETDSNVEEVPE